MLATTGYISAILVYTKQILNAECRFRDSYILDTTEYNRHVIGLHSDKLNTAALLINKSIHTIQMHTVYVDVVAHIISQ